MLCIETKTGSIFSDKQSYSCFKKMGKSQSIPNNIPSRTLYHIIPIILLQFLVTFAQGQGPGGTGTVRANFSIPENGQVGSIVGTIPTRQYYTYSFQESQKLFNLDQNSGVISTKVQLDRESPLLSQNPLNILIIGTHTSGSSQYPIDVYVTVLDINDNAPSFPKPSKNISFYENANIGSQFPIDTATDLDLAENGTVTDYAIVSQNDQVEAKFQVIYDPNSFGQSPMIRLIGELDHEERDSYQLTIVAKDQGNPPLNGSVIVYIHVIDFNDNAPDFGNSEYFASVSERVTKGTVVTRVEATDQDAGSNGEIFYSLIDDSKQFQIDERTGEIYTALSPLKCKSRCDRSASDFTCDANSCILTVEAHDGGLPALFGRTYVVVKIKDENDHSPRIDIRYQPQGNDFSTVNEDAVDGAVVAIVTVSDDDLGSFGNISSFAIVDGNQHGHFRLRSSFNFNYNVIMVNGRDILDRERISMYNLTVKAADQGIPPKTSTAHLLIYVNDVNDHHPMFLQSEYRISISEISPPGSYVASLTAIDLDSGANANLTYSIKSGNTLGWFQVDRFSGLLTVRSQLQFQVSSQVIMNVSVHDGSLNPLYNYTKVIVSISDENDMIPTFNKTQYDVTFIENKPVGSEVITLTAVDEDSGNNGTVVYELHSDVEQLYPSTFQVDYRLGKITIQKSLDREQQSSYVIKLIAKDLGQPSLSSTTTVLISVGDVNDNRPNFYPDEYFANVLENQPSGTSVTTVTALDADDGNYGKVTYFWDGNYPEFGIDQTSGLITTTRGLDRESKNSYILRVKATDVDPSHESLNVAVVTVSIIDQNDEAPTFQNLPYVFSIMEDADSSQANIGRTVGTIQATTRDLQTSISYSIVDGDFLQVFSVNSQSGEITTRKKIDREDNHHYTLTVVANGGSKYSEAFVNISVQDLNDNAPTFKRTNVEAFVVENWPVGHEIFLASAFDPDDGINSDITYSLQTTSDVFEIKVDSGMIYLKKPIDKHSPRNYNLIVVAQDSGTTRLSSSLSVYIVVEDVNDHAPAFSHNSYEISLNESITVNDQFYSLTASDADMGKNGEITYNITRGNIEGNFGIFPDGHLYVARKLNREHKDHYQLTVVASDKAVEPRSSKVNVTIHVLDDNDNYPTFVNISYNFFVPENHAPGIFVGSVSAIDEDIGRNAEVSYFLEINQNNFTINSQTGDITTLKSFDREMLMNTTGNDFYIFDAMVTDNGFNRLQSKVKVTVHITDENDNVPVFSQQNGVYKATVQEDAAVYTRILKVTAVDDDVGENAALSYLILSGNDDEKFDINSGNGQIMLNGSLDREVQERYILHVLVTDSGKPDKFSASCTVFITVIDVNDNNPLFAQSRFEIIIPETMSPGEEIAQFSATDVDLGINSEIIYSFSGAKNSYFNIDTNTGRLYLLKKLDYELNNQYDLVVLASDKGTPKLSSQAALILRVSDTNDNAPKFVNVSSIVSLYENVAPFSPVVKVTAVDQDSGINGQIIYEIKNQDPPGGHFSIQSSGQIYISNAAQIDREKIAMYSLTVIAKDSAVPASSRKSAEKVITINIQDQNDNSPYFKSSGAITIAYPSQQGHVTTIRADDDDAGYNGLVVYELTSGDRSLFSLDSGTGKLFLVKNIPQSPVTYTITVTASDRGSPSKSTRMDFTIILLPQSGSRPTFVGKPYSGEIRENENAGKSILQVRANPVVQNSQLEYYITSVVAEISNIGRHLKINSESGEITTLEILDRELLGSRLNVTVCVVERSTSEPRATTTQVTITILDENDTPPKFTSGLYSNNIQENIAIGTTVAKVIVSDDDITGQVSLGILSGNDGTFKINEQGDISTRKLLNREVKSEYELVIGASDGSNSAQTTVRIILEDVNDNAPKFSRSFYSFDIPENMPNGTTVGRIHATDEDEGTSGEVTYTLVSQWGSDVFHLDEQQGTFTLLQEVDFEQLQLYTLTVRAQDHGNPSLNSTAIVYMNVKDINDNAPVFDIGSYSAEVLENVTVGSTVVMVSATDLDTGYNGIVRFQIVEGDFHDQFSIASENGSIYTTKPLDRETRPYYVLIVMATDQAETPSDRKSTTAQVTVIVKDVNDEAPVFITPSVIKVPENLPIGTVAFNIKAEDKDEGSNGIVTYGMNPHPGNAFRVGPEFGEVWVNTVLDREMLENYTIEVVATDKGLPPKSAVQSLLIQIQDENDNSPVFQKFQYDATVAENVKIGEILVKVSATDRDTGLNGIVRYFIVGGDENFSMDQSSGVLRVQKNLDYEHKKSYNIIIQAEDVGTPVRSSTATVTVNILDVNDNRPIFVDSPYYAHVLENMESLPVYVTQVSARDDDSPTNSQIVYGFRGGIDDNHQELFKINSSTGEITCHRKLDRESLSQYKLVVFATDSGTPRLTGSGTIIVMVDDVNDHTPQFDHGGIYVGHVTENNSPDQKVLTVKARDDDIGKNAHITYLIEGDNRNRFIMDSNSGTISAKVSLDREEQDHYDLVVIARDNGAIPRSASSLIQISVDDVNDNVPQFERQSYNRTIYNQAQSGSFVVGVTALDRDIGDNGLLVYSLTGSGCNQFHINQSTGIVTKTSQLTSSRYSCTVKAVDKGSPPRSSSVSLIIEVSTTTSNNRPVFNTIPSNLHVTENEQLSHVVTTVTASASGQVVRYYIAGGNVGRAFSIDATSGAIKVFGTIDYEMTTVFHLWIEARIGNTQELSAFAEVVVFVDDENDNTPRFSEPLYEASVLEETAGVMLIQVIATDPDSGSNGDIVYKLVSGNVADAFTINKQGEITTRTKLDRETLDSYTLIIEAVDQGAQARTGTTTVRVVVLDINDNPPVFSRQFNVEIMEDIDIGSFVIQVTSSDADIGNNAKVTYSLPENAGSRFAIDSTSGNISVISNLDTETMVNQSLGQKFYQLIVMATDSAFSIQTKLFVFVKDVNDNSPQFIPPLNFDFPERSAPGSFIGTVSARDADFSSPNNQVYYSLKLPSTQFKLNSNNGSLTSLVEMVYTHSIDTLDTTNTKEIIVVATDLGTPPKSSEVIVRVNILDANDHAPVFDQDVYFSAVPENANLGDVIITVSAKDQLDFGINAEITYRINGGNGTGLFRINSNTGEITVGSSLQGKQNQDYILSVEAQDRGIPAQKTSIPVKLSITDVNLFAPVFVSNVFQASVPENAAVGHSIASISALDNDLNGPNGIVRYYIVDGDPKNLFEIDKVQGLLTVQKELDYETVPVHRLNITVRDQGLLYKEISATFTVRLTDVNDNDPVFNKSQFNAFVPENSPSGYIVTQITATDKDTGTNAVITYSLGNDLAASLFSIDQSTGIIRTQGELDYEKKQSYRITVMAVNPGSTKKSTTEVIIHLTGVNEYYPVFVQYQYSFSVKESAANGEQVGIVMATDQDHGEDGIVYYFLIGASNLKGFKIFPKSGQIVVSGKPDYESSPEIWLDVMAKNWGSVKGNDSDVCRVKISVQDANDPPVFSQLEYTANVREGSGGGVSVIQVSAVDNDHRPQDKSFTYTILGGDAGNLFRIEASSGLIVTTGFGTLDRETVPVYNITVGAVDTGTLPQTGSAVVRIHLGDINDNGPLFVPYDLKGYVKENQPMGTSVIKLSEYTFDPDLPPNQGPYQYESVPGNHNSVFSIIGSEGLVQTKVLIDREITPEFKVPVVVKDNGNPTISSTLMFTIVIQDINDSPPTARSMTVITSVFNHVYFQGIIADVRPLDDDIVGNYSCSIIEGDQNKFGIPSGCHLQLKQAPQSVTYPLRISGSDGSSSVKYNVDIMFRHISNNTLENSVILRIKGITPSNFIESKYNRFKDGISSLFNADHTVIIYNIQALGSDVLVYTAVQELDGDYVLYDILKREIQTNKPALQMNIDIIITDVGYSVCSPFLCGQGECLNHVSVNDSFHFVDSPSLVLTSPDLKLNYRCKCPPESSGEHCEIVVSPCGNSHCQNGGHCVSDPFGNKICDCPAGWEGQYCQADINECSNVPCKNQGTCENSLGSYTCNCRDGFTGQNCEIGSDHCIEKPCANGGICRNEVDGFRCECTYTYWGPTCQYASIGFTEGSFMEFGPLAEYDNVIDVTFSTIKMNSLLLYNPSAVANSNEFISLEIVNGNIRFSYSLDYSQKTRLTVPKIVTTGEWFRVQIHRNRKMASVKVGRCPDNGLACEECQAGNTDCYREGSQQSERLNLGGHGVTIGGIQNISTILNHPSQVVTHDFIGCIRNFTINNEDKLRESPVSQKGIIVDQCPRSQAQSSCNNFCKNGGQCVDNWNDVYCKCPDGFIGKTCNEVVKPLELGSPDSMVTFTQREGYRRDQMLQKALTNRKRRAIAESSLMVRFRTSVKKGIIAFVYKESIYSVLWMNNSKLVYSIVDSSNGNTIDTIVVESNDISDGKWHNATVRINGNSKVVSLNIDGVPLEKTIASAFEFSSFEVTKITLGGIPSPYSYKDLKGFNGCVSRFELDGTNMQMDGITDRFIISPSDGTGYGCTQLCENCDSACEVNFETVICSTVAPPSEALGIGVIVVIVFFGVVIVAIVVIFIIFRIRGRYPCKSKSEGDDKVNGHVNKSFCNSSGHSHQDSGFGEVQEEEEIINTHIANKLLGKSYETPNGGLVKPDIINADLQQRKFPLEIDDGTVIIDNGDAPHLPPLNDDMPEHYDLENASSIAPSDIDVVTHYRGFRDGKGHSYGKANPYHVSNIDRHHKSASKHRRNSPSNYIGGQAYNSGLPLQNSAINRQSPAFGLESHHLHNSSRNSPASLGARQSPVHQLQRQSPHVRASPLVHNGSTVRGTPTDIHHSRTDSEHSLASHHGSHLSHSSSSSVPIPRTAVLPNGHIKHGRHKGNVPNGKINPSQNRMGLTIEEINRLNSRPQGRSPVSMLDAVSSSSEGNRRMLIPSEQLSNGVMLEPPESSSSDSANDSFTCSEFEYENDRGRNDLEPGAMIFSKLAEVENENDDSPVHQNRTKLPDGRGSNGDSFSSNGASSEEGQQGKILNGTFNWDYLLNWGPSFEKLVGVFKDIASLPDGEENANNNSNIRNECEEYV